jgi:hypothetical protein
VRRLENDAELLAYAQAFPSDANFMLQTLVLAPNEAGFFYIRSPGEARGALVAMTFRHAPQVLGDGRRSIAALIAADNSGAGRLGLTLDNTTLARVPAAGERVVLTTIASLRAGATYVDATKLITPALTERLDALARSMPDFHLGRFDARFESVAALQAGEFTIIEVNGAGSEAIHFWDPTLSLRAAFAGVFAKQRLLFKLGAQMRARGHRPVGIVALARAWWRQASLIRQYPASN